MKKKLFVLMVVFAMVFSLAACGSGTTDETDTSDEEWSEVVFDSDWLNGTTYDVVVTNVSVSDDYTTFDATVEYDGEEYEMSFYEDGSDEAETVYTFSSGEEASIEDVAVGQTLTITQGDDGILTQVVINE